MTEIFNMISNLTCCTWVICGPESGNSFTIKLPMVKVDWGYFQGLESKLIRSNKHPSIHFPPTQSTTLAFKLGFTRYNWLTQFPKPGNNPNQPLNAYNSFNITISLHRKKKLPEVFCKKGVLTNFAKFTEKQASGLQLYSKSFSVNFA